jgi:hypothetical protein
MTSPWTQRPRRVHRRHDWRVAWHAAITLPLPQVGTMTSDGVPFVAPEIALLFKAKTPRFEDQRDFDRVLPHRDQAARA